MVNRYLKIKYCLLDTSWGEMFVAATREGLCYLSLNKIDLAALRQSSLLRRGIDLVRDDESFSEFGKRLRDYLEGRKVSFPEPLDLRATTPFQRMVWKQTATIPYGEVRSYSWLAEKVGQPRAARAVGRGLALNPLPILIPCHRVVRKNGKLGGFSAGLRLKKRLLELEGVQLSLELDETKEGNIQLSIRG